MSYFQDELDGAVGKKWRKIIVVIAVIITAYILCSLVFSFWSFSVAKGAKL